MNLRPPFVPFGGRVGRGDGPYCSVCGLDLSLSDDQIDFVVTYGNPVPRPPCANGPLHRINAADLRRAERQ